MKKHGLSVHADIEWLHLLTSEWQLIADLSMADLVLWVRNASGKFFALSNARPSSAPTLFYRDIAGSEAPKQWRAGLAQAFESGEAYFLPSEVFDGIQSRFEVVPVRMLVSGDQQSPSERAVAFISRHTKIDTTIQPNKISINYLRAANDLLEMVAHGQYPDFNSPTGSKRGAPRANDGLIRLDEDGDVIFIPTYAARVNLGNVLGAIGRWDDAITQFESAVKLAPENADAHARLGVARVNVGRASEAVSSYETALRLKPGDAALREQFAQVLRALGRTADALAQLERAAELRRSGREE